MSIGPICGEMVYSHQKVVVLHEGLFGIGYWRFGEFHYYAVSCTFCLILVVHDLRFFLLVGFQVPLVVLVLHLVVASVANRLIFWLFVLPISKLVLVHLRLHQVLNVLLETRANNSLNKKIINLHNKYSLCVLLAVSLAVTWPVSGQLREPW